MSAIFRSAILTPLSLAAALATDREQCRQALADYNDAVVAVHAAVREYERCVTASLARDDCGAELVELDVTHRDFERAVDERRAKCQGIGQ